MPRVKKKKRKASRKKNQDSPRLGFGARLSLLVLGTITIIVLLSWVWQNRWPHSVAALMVSSSIKATMNVGFAVSDVTVQGRHYTSRDDLFKALGVKAGSPIVLFDPDKAYKNIMALPWTKSVTVLRSMPNKIMVKLVERKPIARLQHNKRTIVIDSNGKELTAARPDQFGALPLIVGNAEPKQTRYLLASLTRYPTIARVLKAAVRVGKRRWDFHLRPKLLVRMPQRGLQKALKKLETLIRKKKILERNIKTIDLRIKDRMILEPYKEAETQQ